MGAMRKLPLSQLTWLMWYPAVVMHSGTLSSLCGSFVCSASKQTNHRWEEPCCRRPSGVWSGDRV